MEEKIALQLLNFEFSKIAISVNEDFSWPSTPVNLDPIITKKIVKIDENTVKTYLFFKISKNINKPFSIDVSLHGTFHCESWDKTEIGKILSNINTVNILFPYLRQSISTLTSMSGLPTYTIPVMDVSTIVEE